MSEEKAQEAKAWLVRARNIPVRCRDGFGAKAPVYSVGPDWVAFRNLPAGIDPDHLDSDMDLEVMQVSAEEAKAHRKAPIKRPKVHPITERAEAKLKASADASLKQASVIQKLAEGAAERLRTHALAMQMGYED